MYGISLPHMSRLLACTLCQRIFNIRNGTSLCKREVHVGTSVCVYATSSFQGDGTCLLARYDSGCGGRERIVSDHDSYAGNKSRASDVCKSPHTRILRVRNANKVSHLSLMIQQTMLELWPEERVRTCQERLAFFSNPNRSLARASLLAVFLFFNLQIINGKKKALYGQREQRGQSLFRENMIAKI